MDYQHKSVQHDGTEEKRDNDINDNPDITDAKAMFEELHKKALSMGIKQHQLGRLLFVKNTRRAKWKRFRNNVMKAICAVIAAAFILALFWNLNWPVSRDSLANLVWHIRGEDPVYAEGESCLFRASERMRDWTRSPIDCDFCQRVTKVERVSKLSVSDFVDKFAYSGHPVVVTDGASNWSAVKVFSFDYFKRLYNPDSPVLESECQFFPYRTDFDNLSQVFQMDEDRAMLRDGSDPWYIGWQNCDSSAGEELRQHYSRPYFLPAESESSQTDWIFMGSPGYGAHMHVDNVGLPSWQAQLSGHKTWTLESPPECYHTCVISMAVTVHPGDIIVVDTNKWFHSTLVVGDDVSITIGSEYD